MVHRDEILRLGYATMEHGDLVPACCELFDDGPPDEVRSA